jgi:tRNA 5-methylaminomethyl-2-thiouridine biosynthesis bifunctional protein
VTVLDAAAAPAAGASSLPAGLLAPHFSSDDGLLSRLSRCGARLTLQQARELLREGTDWAPTGVLEVRSRVEGAPEGEHDALAPWSRVASPAQREAAGLPAGTAALWHEQAGWIQPAALVRAWLSESGVAWQGNAHVERLVRDGNDWVLHGPHDEKLARAPLVVVAAALGSAALLGDAILLRPVRGQVSWAVRGTEVLPPFPLNGNGHFIPDVPQGTARAWFSGSTFDAGETSLVPRTDDHAFNLERLNGLAPQAAQQVAPMFASGAVQAWTGVRCASRDRRPLLGEIRPGLWVCTAMGSRGLTFAALCGELLAARLHGEPLPLERKLAQALRAAR